MFWSNFIFFLTLVSSFCSQKLIRFRHKRTRIVDVWLWRFDFTGITFFFFWCFDLSFNRKLSVYCLRTIAFIFLLFYKEEKQRVRKCHNWEGQRLTFLSTHSRSPWQRLSFSNSVLFSIILIIYESRGCGSCVSEITIKSWTRKRVVSFFSLPKEFNACGR